MEQELGALPEPVREHLRDLPVMVEPLPERTVLTAEARHYLPTSSGSSWAAISWSAVTTTCPTHRSAIYLFRRNLLRVCRDRAELGREIQVTVQHEVGHYLGLDEEDLDRWGLA